MTFWWRAAQKAIDEILVGEPAKVLADSLRSDGEKWKKDEGGFHLKRDNIKIWISNEAYGLHVETNEGKWKPNKNERELIWSAVNGLLEARGNAISRRIADRLMDELR